MCMAFQSKRFPSQPRDRGDQLHFYNLSQHQHKVGLIEESLRNPAQVPELE